METQLTNLREGVGEGHTCKSNLEKLVADLLLCECKAFAFYHSEVHENERLNKS